MQFYVNGELFWTENREPYIMVTGNRKWWGAPGPYTTTAMPYSARNGGGLAGISRTICFTISDIATNQSSIASRVAGDTLRTAADKYKPITVYPVPAKEVLYLLPGREFIDQEVIVVIRDRQGQVVIKDLIQITADPYALEIDQMRLNNGLYYIQLTTKKVSKSVRFIKE